MSTGKDQLFAAGVMAVIGWTFAREIKKGSRDGWPSQRIPGGRASGKSPSSFNQRQLRRGTRVEMEHTNDRAVAREIAMDHLDEDPQYYEKLEIMERS